MRRTMYELSTDYLFDLHLDIARPSETIALGVSGSGTRFIFPITGGWVRGPKVNGTVKPLGADWAFIRPDNAFIIDVRILLETDDGAFIDIIYDGIATFTDEQIEGFGQGVFPKEAQCLITPRFQTGHSSYLWLNKIKAVASGKVFFKGDDVTVEYSVYALR